MAKRFTDSNKYKKPFIRSLKGPYKLLWDYLYHDCEHTGIWIVDFDAAQFYLGSDMKINKSDAIKYFNSDEVRIVEIDNGKKWFIPSFIEFQYGQLSDNNTAHRNVIKELLKFSLLTEDLKPLYSPFKGAYIAPMEEDKDKDKEGKDSVKGKGKLFIPPALTEVIEYFKLKGYKESVAKKFHEYYETGSWKDSKGNSVKNWKQKAQSVWFKPENEDSSFSKINSYPSKYKGFNFYGDVNSPLEKRMPGNLISKVFGEENYVKISNAIFSPKFESFKVRMESSTDPIEIVREMLEKEQILV